jgi:AcrR family transcriptional regulator
MAHEKISKRRYQLKKRADTMAETRQRIAAAAAELHGTVGPARTTMSAVADRAGVQRHTVYRHFPTEADLFGACSAHFFTEHPLPDIEPWRRISDPRQRLEQVLDDLYAYYESTERMFSNVLRDAELIEDLRPTLVPMKEYLDEVAEILATGWVARGRRRHLLMAATRHAVDFQAWRSLTQEDRITRAEAIELIVGLVETAVAPPSGTAR